MAGMRKNIAIKEKTYIYIYKVHAQAENVATDGADFHITGRLYS